MKGKAAMGGQQAPYRYADDLWIVDTLFLGEPGVIASYLIAGDSGLALIDVGPSSTVEVLLAGVRLAGFDPLDIRQLVLTHVHLDHAGAAGVLTRLLPQAQVYVHRAGAPHLIDPSKLAASARRIYGDRTEALWGTIEPVPAARLSVLDDGDEVRVGKRTLSAVYTPGHAVHHVAYADARRREVFAGDVAGVRLQGTRLLRPPTPPADLNVEDWDRSLDCLLTLAPEAIYLAHFGRFSDVGWHIGALRNRLHAWAELTLAGMRAGKSEVELARMLEESNARDAAAIPQEERSAELRRYEAAASLLMSVQGFMRYYSKVHPELLTV
jgi:glyoxylase-like metal-dependent hydrolase (beta-lactamase superfamily II)